jgi:hypothetical protein
MVCGFCVYITGVMVQKKPKHIREENYFIYVHFEVWIIYVLFSPPLEGCAKSLPPPNMKYFHQGFISHSKKMYPPGKCKILIENLECFFLPWQQAGKKGG